MSELPDDQTFEQLAAGYFDQTLTQAELARFQQLLRADDACVRRFAELAQLEQMIGQEVAYQHRNMLVAGSIDPEDSSDTRAARVLAELARLEGAAEAEPVVLTPPQHKPMRARRQEPDLSPREIVSVTGYLLGRALTTRPALIAYAAALVLLAAVLLIPWGGAPKSQTAQQQTPSPAPQPAPIAVATLTDTHNAQWAAFKLSAGDALYANQRLTLTEGFAEITTNRGAVAILEAPATIELTDSDNALRLETGKLVGICETDSSKGFVVRTPHMDITDLGTEFGVDVRHDAVDASVFVGEIQVELPTGNTQAITTNRTAKVSFRDGLPHLVVEDEIGQTYTRRTPRSELVTDASINLSDFDVNVLHQSVYEDVKLYIDREHQLNGIDQEGLPKALLGGDLIQMPASARLDLNPHVGKRLELEIDVSRPADIYLLIEVETELEPWVQEQFVKTSMLAGNDHLVQSDGRRLGIGPGISIDRTFEIWKRRAPVTERTTITGSMQGTMYAVIAVPVTETEINNRR